MMRRDVFALFFSIVWILAPGARAADTVPLSTAPLEAWMPDDVIGFVKVSGLGARVAEFLTSDIRRELEKLDVVKAGLASPEWAKFQAALDAVKSSTGKEPLKVFQDLLGKELLVGARLGFGGPEVVLLTRAAGQKEVADLVQALKSAAAERGIVLEGAKSTRGDVEIETVADHVSHAMLGSVWAVSNSRAALERVVDLAQGKASGSVKASSVFAKAGEAVQKGSLATLVVRPQFIPNWSIPEKADNPLGSLIGGGWLGALEASELLVANLGTSDGNVALDLSSVLNARGKEEKFLEKLKSFFPEVAPSGLKERLEARGALAVLELQRNLAQWWEKREDLLDTKSVGDLTNFNQIMSTFFGGKSFQDEVLPELGPTVAIVARNQDYRSLSEHPKPAIPAFAAIFELKNAEDSADEVKGAFDSLIAIIRLDQAQKKKEGMSMSMISKVEMVGDVELRTVALAKATKKEKPTLMHNFTPSLAIVGSRVVISSSSELARLLIEELPKSEGGKTAAPGKAEDLLSIDGKAVRAILGENLEFLVADNMMKKGKSRAEAEGEMRALLDILDHVASLSVGSARKGDRVELKAMLQTKLAGRTADAKEAKL